MAKVKAQTPAYGVSENAEWPDTKTFTVECECTSQDHAINTHIEIDADKEFDQLEVTHWVEMYTPAHNVSRWKVIWSLLWKGYHTEQQSIMLTRQAAKNWISAVDAAIDHLEKEDENAKK